MLEVANLIAVVGGDTTAHEVRQRARCHNEPLFGSISILLVGTAFVFWLLLSALIKRILA